MNSIKKLMEAGKRAILFLIQFSRAPISAFLIVLFTLFVSYLFLNGAFKDPNKALLDHANLREFLSFSSTSFSQAFLGASFGAVAAFFAVMWHERSLRRRELSVDIIRSAHTGDFMKLRREAAAYLMKNGYIGPNERPTPKLKMGLTDFFDMSIDRPDDPEAPQGIIAVRSIMAFVEMIGDITHANTIDQKMIERSLGGFLRYWHNIFQELLDEEAKKDVNDWSSTIHSLHLTKTYYGTPDHIQA